jgi:molybdenum cofactor biosynthesis protein B
MSRARIATITSSDTRTEADDVGGRVLRGRLGAAGFTLASHTIVREDPGALSHVLGALLEDESIEAVVITGGTGLSPRDRTVEALTPLFTKRMDGFGEAFRRLSFDAIGPRAILSNATAGVVRGRLVFAVPGSVAAVELAVDALIAPCLDHAVALVSDRPHGHAHAHASSSARGRS